MQTTMVPGKNDKRAKEDIASNMGLNALKSRRGEASKCTIYSPVGK